MLIKLSIPPKIGILDFSTPNCVFPFYQAKGLKKRKKMTDLIKISIEFQKKKISQITKEFLIDSLQDPEQKHSVRKLMEGTLKSLNVTRLPNFELYG